MTASDPFREVVTDPLARIVIQHDQQIHELRTYFRIGVAVATTGVSLLGAILGVLLTRL